MPVNIVHGTQSELILFLVLNMWPSHFGLPILLAVILFSKRVHRHPTLVNLCLGYILIGVASSVLLYAGKISGPEPSKMLCLFQASMLYGVPAFASLLALMLVLQMFLVVRATIQKQVSQGPHAVRLWVMIAAPYLALLISIFATAAVGATNPDIVTRHRRFFYCSVDSDLLSGSIAAFGAIFLLATVFFEVWTVVILYKNRKVAQQPGAKPRIDVELSLPLRVMAFGLYVIVALSLSLLSMKAPESPIPDLVIACAATVIILIFGTQPDIIRALCFWRKEPTLHFSNTGSTVTPTDVKPYTQA
jgi:quinol-cytochrome oxidoreductase complex cytochrome b subunit